MAKGDSKTKLCTADGCGRPLRARGLCSSHYNQQYQPNRHRKVTVPCTLCGADVVKDAGSRKGQRPYCDYTCRDLDRWGSVKTRIPRDHPVMRLIRERRDVPTVAPKRRLEPRFTSCICDDCGAPFLLDRLAFHSTASYCSKRCAARSARRRRRAREYGAPGSLRWVEVIEVHLRLGRCCAYCEQPVEGQPDPDHVVPLSRGGRNDISNVVSTCRMCNADKCDLTLEEWSASRSTRGLAPVRTDFSGDPRFRHLILRPASGPAWRDRAS